MAQKVKILPGTQETQVHSLGQEDLLEKGMATHYSIFAWSIPWGRKESDTTERLNWTEMIFPLHSLFPRVLSELVLLHNVFVVSAFKWKLLQLCPTLCNSMDCSPPGSSVHGILQSKNTVVGCHSLLQGIIPTQRPNLGLLDCRQIFYHLSYQGSPMWERLCLSHTKPFMLFRTCQSS